MTAAFVQGLGIGIGVTVAYWCLTSLRDFLTGLTEKP